MDFGKEAQGGMELSFDSVAAAFANQTVTVRMGKCETHSMVKMLILTMVSAAWTLKL